MPRMKPDNIVKQRMWAALLKAAKRHHRQDADRGMVTRIATDAGVSKAAVSDWKNGGNYPEPSTLRRLADLYGVSAEELSGYVESPPSGPRALPADDLLRRSIDITEQVLGALKPDATLAETMATARRANALLLQGCTDVEVRGYLFEELTNHKEA